MSNPAFSESGPSNSASAGANDLSQIHDLIYAVAARREGDSLALLELLRQLNDIHYDIRETIFRNALPDNRQKLYSLLKDIEQSGGWPYIQRMKLLALLENMDLDQADSSTTDPHATDTDTTDANTTDTSSANNSDLEQP